MLLAAGLELWWEEQQLHQLLRPLPGQRACELMVENLGVQLAC